LLSLNNRVNCFSIIVKWRLRSDALTGIEKLYPYAILWFARNNARVNRIDVPYIRQCDTAANFIKITE